MQNRWGDVKNSIGNGETKELICTTHGHELRVGELLEGMGVLGGGGESCPSFPPLKNWDNFPIINKVYS